jgi:hypothetical protein
MLTRMAIAPTVEDGAGEVDPATQDRQGDHQECQHSELARFRVRGRLAVLSFGSHGLAGQKIALICTAGGSTGHRGAGLVEGDGDCDGLEALCMASCIWSHR